MDEFRFASKKTVPVLCGYLFMGAAFGLLFVSAGFPWYAALACSLLIYAGSVQYAFVPLLAQHASLGMIGAMTLLLNARHIFYGLSFVESFQKAGKARPYLIFALTDETYSLLCGTAVQPPMRQGRVFFWISLLDQCYWILGTAIGAFAGTALPFDMTGVDFAMTALFAVIFVEQWKSAKSHRPAITGLVIAVVFLIVLGPEQFLLPTLLVTVFFLLLQRKKLEGVIGHE